MKTNEQASFDRRAFLKASAAGAATLAGIMSAEAAGTAFAENAIDELEEAVPESVEGIAANPEEGASGSACRAGATAAAAA